MLQNPDPHRSLRRLPPDVGIRGDFEPIVIIRDTVTPSSALALVSREDGLFVTTHLTVE